MQLTKYGVRLIDIYGIIGGQDINTLEHLGVKFDWSVYNPTKKSEILEAERSKDEMRDIMSRMIGAEIRYVRLGYRVRTAPFGYKNEKAETAHGKRCILVPHPQESVWITEMYNMRVEGILTDQEIVEKINALGYMSRKTYFRNPRNRTEVHGLRGGKKLHIKQLHKYLQNPIYAGINMERWTQGQPIKARFDSLVSIDQFNTANRGKIVILEEDGEIKLFKDKPEDWRIKKQTKNPLFPYRRYVLCPECGNNFYGSVSKGKTGKGFFPAYHCNGRGSHKYVWVQKKNFEETIHSFIKSIKFTDEYVETFRDLVLTLWKERKEKAVGEQIKWSERITELEAKAKLVMDKIKILNSEAAIKYLETELETIEEQRLKAVYERSQQPTEDNNTDINQVLDYVTNFFRHFEETLIDRADPIKSAGYFGILFDEVPTYEELKSQTPSLACCFALNQAYNTSKSLCARSEGLEPPTPSSEAKCSNPLSYERKHVSLYQTVFFNSTKCLEKNFPICYNKLPHNV